MKFWRRNVNTVFIMLGNSCNMNCAYCLQHSLIRESLSQKVNLKIYDFLDALSKENKSGKIRLVFYGGEPLLYFSVIREIAEEIRERRISADYSVITNGRALTDEMTEFFCGENFHVTVSWDGYRTRETRRFDVMADPEIREKILRLPHLCLSGVISAKAYPMEILEAFQDIADDYEDRNHEKLQVNLDEIFDTGITDKKLLSVDYDRVSHDMRKLALMYMHLVNGGGYRREDDTKLMYISGIIRRLWDFYVGKDGKWDSSFVSCGNGIRVLNLDLEGNLYPCHNTSESIGDIETPYETYLENLKKGDRTRERRYFCLTCPALSYCRGGCKLVGDKARNETYCKLKRALIEPVLQVIRTYGGETA